jgi:uncharacterized protein
MPTLSDRLKSLGVKVGARDLPPPAPRHAYAIDQIVPGTKQTTAFGDAFVVESDYTAEYRHGRLGLRYTHSLQTIAEWARDERLAHCSPEGLLFLDTETTGLAGGTGTYAFLIGIGRLVGDRFHLSQIFMRDPIEEPAALAALAEMTRSSAALVTFNGKTFDVPLLNARYVTNRAPSPFAALAHLDLLPLARRLWRERLESRALGSLEVHILGAQRTEEDIPGWLIPQIYFDYLRNGDARPLKRVLYHNAMDVLAMAALLNHVTQMLTDPLAGANPAQSSNPALEHGLDLIAMARMFEDLDRLEEAVVLFRRGLTYDIPEEIFRQTMQRLALVHRRRGELAEAVEIWRQATETRQMYAFVELAKYYEHQVRDYSLATQWTRDALAILDTADLHVRQQWHAELSHRLARLEKKLVISPDTRTRSKNT